MMESRAFLNAARLTLKIGGGKRFTKSYSELESVEAVRERRVANWRNAKKPKAPAARSHWLLRLGGRVRSGGDEPLPS
jgi:hypothetical protein